MRVPPNTPPCANSSPAGAEPWSRPSQAKTPCSIRDLRAIVGELDDFLRDIRDRALLLIGFADAFRRSELVGIELEHVSFVPEGLVIRVPSVQWRKSASGIAVGPRVGQPRAWLTVAGTCQMPGVNTLIYHSATIAAHRRRQAVPAPPGTTTHGSIGFMPE